MSYASIEDVGWLVGGTCTERFARLGGVKDGLGGGIAGEARGAGFSV